MSTVQTAHVGMLNRFSRVRLFVTPRTVARQAPLSMGFSSQECWSGVPFPSPGDLPDPGLEPGSPALQTESLSTKPLGKPSNHQSSQFSHQKALWTHLPGSCCGASEGLSVTLS